MLALFGGEIRSDLGIGHGEFGALYSAGTLISAGLLFFTGPLIDKVDLRWWSISCLAGLALACSVLALSYHWLMLLPAFVLIRQFGQSLLILTASTATVRYIDQQRGTANALSGMGYRAAEAIVPLLVVTLLLHWSWREIQFGIAASLLLFVAPIALLLLRGHTLRHAHYLQNVDITEGHTDHREWTRSEVLRDSRFWLLIPALSSGAMLFTGFIFHQVHLVESKGWSLQAWGAWFAVFGLVSITTALLAGRAVDRFTALALAPYLAAPLALALLVLASTDAAWSAGLFLSLMAISTGAIATCSAPLFAELYGTTNLGGVKSVSSSIMVFSSALSPVTIGSALDAGVSIEKQAAIAATYCVSAIALALAAKAQSS